MFVCVSPCSRVRSGAPDLAGEGFYAGQQRYRHLHVHLPGEEHGGLLSRAAHQQLHVVKGSAFTAGGGFGGVAAPDQHNSPNTLRGPNVVGTSNVIGGVTWYARNGNCAGTGGVCRDVGRVTNH